MDPRISKVNDYVLAMIIASLTASFSLMAYLFVNFHALSQARLLVISVTTGILLIIFVVLSLLFFYLIFKEVNDE